VKGCGRYLTRPDGGQPIHFDLQSQQVDCLNERSARLEVLFLLTAPIMSVLLVIGTQDATYPESSRTT
jgi:hypothetical protein